MEELEDARVRLSNVRTVEPILGALRTISLGSWQAVLAQRGYTRRYSQRLVAMLTALWPALPSVPRSAHTGPNAPSSAKRVILLVIGSERGLCGRFNSSVFERAEEYLDEAQAAELQVELAILGTRLVRLARRAGYIPSWFRALSVTSLPPSHVTFELTRQWLALYEAGALDTVDVAYNAYRRMGDYVPTVARLVPPTLPAAAPGAREEVWPPPIVETDPLSLYARIAEQHTALHLYELLLESAAAEHSARYQLMEAATQNAKRLIGELTLAVQSTRRQTITREVQELAVGAGLLGRQRR